MKNIGIVKRFFAAITLSMILIFLVSCSSEGNSKPNLQKMYNESNAEVVKLREENKQLIQENATFKSDLQGGRTASETIKSLNKREQDLNKREQDLDRREKLLEKREQSFEQKNNDIYSQKEEVGAAKQIQKDYEEQKQLVKEVSNERDQAVFLRTIFMVIGVVLLVPLIWIFILYINLRRKMENNEQVIRAAIDNPSASPEQIRNILDALRGYSQPMKMINSQSDSSS